MDARIVTENLIASRYHTALELFSVGNELIAVREIAHNGDDLGLYDPCGRCGSGLGHFMFNGMDDICYRCGGEAHEPSETTLEDAVRRYDARAKRQAREAAKRQAAALQAAHEIALWMDQNPTVVAALKPFETRQGFLGDMARTIEEGRILTPRQHDAVVEAFAKMAEKAAASPGHWGEVGVRAELTATVTRVVPLPDNGFGPSLLIKLRTEEGHELVTFTTAAWAWEASEGDVYTGKATVKKHDEFNGTAQTVITRAKFDRVGE